MGKKSQMFFTSGKEKALKEIFTGESPTFGYIALGYVQDASTNGFESESDFQELEDVNYERLPISLDTTSTTEVDTDTGKVLVKFTATLPNSIILDQKSINQIAVVDNKNIGANTTIYCATTFPTFTKTQDSSITFILGFRI